MIYSEIERERLLFRSVFNITPNPLVVIDQEGMLILSNIKFNLLMNITPEQEKHSNLFSLEQSILEQSKKAKLKTALENKEDFKISPFEINISEGKKNFAVYGKIIRQSKDVPYRILLQFEEIPL